MVNMGEIFAYDRIPDIHMDRVPLSEKESETYLLQAGDLLFARQSLVLSGAGKCSVFLGASEPVTFESHLIRARLDNKLADPMFYYYFFTSSIGRNAIESIVEQVAAAGIRGGDLAKLPVICPPLPIQRRIAHILGTLDDKIEHNRRTNATLEAMARALFKSWFVDFDPVRAKADGRAPAGMSAELAAHFPDSFEDSPLGKVPRGWGVGKLDDLIDFVVGGDWGKDTPTEAINAPALCIRGADIPSLQTGGAGNMPLRYLKSSSLKKRSLVAGNIVVEISGGSPTQSTGRPVLITEELLNRLVHPLVCSNFCRMLRLKSPNLSSFIYLWLRWLYSTDEFLQYENGTTGIKNFAFTVFNQQHPLLIPPDAIVESFNQQVGILIKSQQIKGTQSETLAALRDALLPKLLSGAVAVGEEIQEEL